MVELTMRKSDAAPIALVTWMLAVSGLMFILDIAGDFKLFVATALAGFFVIVYLIHPAHSRPRYMRGVYAMTAACTLLFGAVIALKILELLPP